MKPNFSYHEFTAELKGLDSPSFGSGNGIEAAKRLAFLLIWVKFQFAWRMGKLDLGLSMRYRPLIYLTGLLILSGLALLPVFIRNGNWGNSAAPVAITLPQIPTQSNIAPDTLLNYVSLNPLCHDE